MSGARGKPPVLGILGGGQLARMLALAAAPLGVRCIVVDQHADACAGHVAELVVADWSEVDKLRAFARRVDAVTFDFENVPAELARTLAADVAVWPPADALAVSQDRVVEKTVFRECGIMTAEFAAVATRAELDQALARIGAPAILKTRRFGYDGKGQFRLKTLADADAAWDALKEPAAADGLILEAFVPFVREASMLAVRSRDGELKTWPLVQNSHTNGVLTMSLAPAPDSAELQREADVLVHKLAKRLDYVGVLALELFVTADGGLLGNEMAPRVHNSGHWSIEGAYTSQFENHVRAVLGMPLGDTGVRGHSAMFNWLGELPALGPVLRTADAHWHDYGKAPRPGRKTGHATLCATDSAVLAERVAGVAQALHREAQAAPILEALRRIRG